MKAIITAAAAAALLVGGAGIANAAYSDGNASASAFGSRYVALYAGSQASLGRYTKTPSGNFNSTRSLLEGTASGEGSGQGAGSPNGG